jgi:hypothetical protein
VLAPMHITVTFKGTDRAFIKFKGIVWSPVLLVIITYELEKSLTCHEECIHTKPEFSYTQSKN